MAILLILVVATAVSAATGFCPPGQHVLEDRCRDCDRGTFSSDGQCERCAAGSYQPKTGQLACFPCQAGHFANSSGATFCKPCAAGHFAPRQGAAVCSLCPPGHQQPQAGQSACIPDYIVAMQRNIDDLQEKNKYQQDQIKVLQQKIDESIASQEADVCSTSCVTSLKSSVASLQSSTAELQKKTGDLQTSTASLQRSTTQLQTKTYSLQKTIESPVLSRTQPYGTVVVNGHPVCDDKFDMNDAKVVCRMFGYRRAVEVKSVDSKNLNYYNYPYHSGTFSYDNLQCTGSESSLSSCPHGANFDCFDGEEAGVVCSH